MNRSEEFVDYHVGMVRGFLYGKDAPPNILSSLKIILEGYHSKAGEKIATLDKDVIGNRDEGQTLSEHIREVHSAPEISRGNVSELFTHKKAEPGKRKEWTNKDEEIIKQYYNTESADQIGERLGRPKTQVYNRIHKMKKEGRLDECNV